VPRTPTIFDQLGKVSLRDGVIYGMPTAIAWWLLRREPCGEVSMPPGKVADAGGQHCIIDVQIRRIRN
jgi:hypothetical protein